MIQAKPQNTLNTVKNLDPSEKKNYFQYRCVIITVMKIEWIRLKQKIFRKKWKKSKNRLFTFFGSKKWAEISFLRQDFDLEWV